MSFFCLFKFACRSSILSTLAIYAVLFQRTFIKGTDFVERGDNASLLVLVSRMYLELLGYLCDSGYEYLSGRTFHECV